MVPSSHCTISSSHVTILLSHSVVPPFFFLTFDDSIITLGSTKITFDHTFLTFGGTLIFFYHIWQFHFHIRQYQYHIWLYFTSFSCTLISFLTSDSFIVTLGTANITCNHTFITFNGCSPPPPPLTFNGPLGRPASHVTKIPWNSHKLLGYP